MLFDGLMVWWLRRRGARSEQSPRDSSRNARRAGLVAVLLAEFPLLRLAPPSIPEKLWGDAETHARMGRDLARYGLESGWLDGILAGFPFAQHYPPLPWLALALEISCGVSPVRAVQWLGWLFLALTPLVVYGCLVQIPRMSAIFAALGAIFFAWIAPYNEFFGGYEVFFSCGLLAQTMGLPLVLLWMRSVVRRDSSALILLWSGLVMGTHPQLGVAGFLFLGIGLVAIGRAPLLRTYLWASAALGAFGFGIYGQGMATFRVPFGWPEGFGWRHMGFPASRLVWWLEDWDLFDQNGNGLLTALSIAAWLLALPRLKQPAVRAVAAVFALGLLISVSGPSLPKLGVFGALILKFIQPLRFVALLPVAGAALVAVVSQAWSKDLSQLARGIAPVLRAVWVERGLGVALALLCAPSIAGRIDYATKWPQMLTNFVVPRGYDFSRVRSWLLGSPEQRVWFDSTDSELVKLAGYDGFSVNSTRAIATTSAVGAHVGFLLAASQKIEPKRAGSDRRAEALGVRNVLTTLPQSPEGWRVVDRSGEVAFLEHERPTDLVGLGCVVGHYTGSNAALSNRLHADLRDAHATDRILDPEKFLEIRWSAGEVVETGAAPAGCLASDARARLISSSPGLYRVAVESSHPIDVVLRVTYFQSWKLSLDGAPQALRAVAPGFLTLRVPPGRHEITADSAVWAGMRSSLGLAALALLALALGRSPLARSRLLSSVSSGRSRVSTRPSV